jgi:hypothetical protein
MPTPSRQDNAARFPKTDRLSLSVAEFCAATDISISTYEKMKQKGWAPREMRVGRKVLISRQAALDWIAEREQATTKEVIQK